MEIGYTRVSAQERQREGHTHMCVQRRTEVRNHGEQAVCVLCGVWVFVLPGCAGPPLASLPATGSVCVHLALMLWSGDTTNAIHLTPSRKSC